ncbi:DUF1702 family protein [Nocardia wallacei]|uniref:DUF1702 family protein n=1 Tax=Nocardia wallacei TaxID=480035 RepID=UPI0024584960|nr:DUF1702 family protein [Nocardia wallacei]
MPSPSMNDMKFAVRGFPVAATAVSRRYEGVSRAVLEGFEYGADIADPDEVAARLEWVDPLYRSLAYEGAVAALALRDLLAFGRTRRAERFVRGHGEPHSMIAYIGFGLVMSRLPRALWQRALPRFDANPLLAHLTWLAVDGYAFDRAFFDPKRWLIDQRRPPRFPWEGFPDYFPRAFDQGLGRAVAFYHAGDYEAIAVSANSFDDDRRADVWSGVGVVAAYLGGQPRARLQTLVRAAGEYAPDLAVGAVMGIKARQHARYVPENTELAADVVCGGSVESIAALAETSAEPPAEPTGSPGYELWRTRIRSEFADLAARTA